MNKTAETNNLIAFPLSENDSQEVISSNDLTDAELKTFLQENEEHASIDLTFKLDSFEGPLDLLLHLIKKSKLEIENVKLSEITEQYLSIMKEIDNIDLEVASEFIEVAATLIEIKSKALLPRLVEEDDEEEDPEALLLQRLNEYRLFKDACEQLKPLESVDRFYKDPEPDANKFRIVIKDMQLDLLLDAFTGILTRVSEVEKISKPKEVKREVFTVGSKIAAIKDALVLEPKIRFSQLFETSSSRDEIITTFLALLEMLKLQEVKIFQSQVFDDIEIVKADDNNG